MTRRLVRIGEPVARRRSRVGELGPKWEIPDERTGPMTIRLRYIGLDVHNESIVIAVAEQVRPPCDPLVALWDDSVDPEQRLRWS